MSHTQGEATVASRIVLIGGVAAKHLYRTYNIQTVEGVDDYKSMEEVTRLMTSHPRGSLPHHTLNLTLDHDQP